MHIMMVVGQEEFLRPRVIKILESDSTRKRERPSLGRSKPAKFAFRQINGARGAENWRQEFFFLPHVCADKHFFFIDCLQNLHWKRGNAVLGR